MMRKSFSHDDSSSSSAASASDRHGWMMAKKKGKDDDRIARDRKVALERRRRLRSSSNKEQMDETTVRSIKSDIKKDPHKKSARRPTTSTRSAQGKGGSRTSTEDRARLRQQLLIHQIRTLVHEERRSNRRNVHNSMNDKGAETDHKKSNKRVVVTPEQLLENHNCPDDRNTKPSRKDSKRTSLPPEKRRKRDPTSLDIRSSMRRRQPQHYCSSERFHQQCSQKETPAAKRRLMFQSPTKVKRKKASGTTKPCRSKADTDDHVCWNAGLGDEPPSLALDYDKSARLILESHRIKWSNTTPRSNTARPEEFSKEKLVQNNNICDKKVDGERNRELFQETAKKPKEYKTHQRRAVSNRGIMLLSSYSSPSASDAVLSPPAKADTVDECDLESRTDATDGDNCFLDKTSSQEELPLLQKSQAKKKQGRTATDSAQHVAGSCYSRTYDGDVKAHSSEESPGNVMEAMLETQEDRCDFPIPMRQPSEADELNSPAEKHSTDLSKESTLLLTQQSSQLPDHPRASQPMDLSSAEPSSCGIQSQPDSNDDSFLRHGGRLNPDINQQDSPHKASSGESRASGTAVMLPQQPSHEDIPRSQRDDLCATSRTQVQELQQSALGHEPSILSLPWHASYSPPTQGHSEEDTGKNATCETSLPSSSPKQMDPLRELMFWKKISDSKRSGKDRAVPSFHQSLAAIIVAKNQKQSDKITSNLLWLPSILESGMNLSDIGN